MRRLGCLVAGLIVLSGCALRRGTGIAVVEIPYPPGMAVVHRAEWGWQPLRASIFSHRVIKITIHHGGEDFPPDKDPVTYLRNLQSWSRNEKKWIDLPYHFLIDFQGHIYEGRPINYPGDTNTDYDPRGHALICLLGNFEHQEVTEQQFQALVALTAHLVKIYGVPLTEIKGHRDYSSMTVCPGKNLYHYLEDGSLIQAVKEELAR